MVIILGMILADLITVYMEQGQVIETFIGSAGQEVPRLLWNSKFYHSFPKTPQIETDICQLNPIHTLIFPFREDRF
jgi:hypothetical protein